MNESHGPQVFAREKVREIFARLHTAVVNLVYDCKKSLLLKCLLYARILRTFRIFAPLHENRSLHENCVAPITRLGHLHSENFFLKS